MNKNVGYLIAKILILLFVTSLLGTVIFPDQALVVGFFGGSMFSHMIRDFNNE